MPTTLPSPDATTRPRAALVPRVLLLLALAACQDGSAVTGVTREPDGIVLTLGSGDIIRDLAPPAGMVENGAYGINNTGQMAGYGTTATGASQAYLWQPNGSVAALAVPVGWSSSYGLFVNDSMVSGGAAINAAGQMRAVRWRNGTMTDLGTLPGGGNSVALGVNPAGAIVGWSEVRMGNGVAVHAFLWSQADGMRDLGTLPGGMMSHAAEVSANRHVSGTSYGADGSAHAFLWTPSNGIRALPEPGGTRESSAVGNNSLGDAVGFVTRVADNTTRAVLWRRTGGVVTLPGLAANSETLAFDINDNGVIVGYSEIAPGGAYRAVMWTRRTNGSYRVTDLRLAGGIQAAHAQAISEGKDGQPVRVAGIHYLNGRVRGVMWQ
jgi:probable HAF family extracellular repeat protein